VNSNLQKPKLEDNQNCLFIQFKEFYNLLKVNVLQISNNKQKNLK
jgi:hypothetical protein